MIIKTHSISFSAAGFFELVVLPHPVVPLGPWHRICPGPLNPRFHNAEHDGPRSENRIEEEAVWPLCVNRKEGLHTVMLSSHTVTKLPPAVPWAYRGSAWWGRAGRLDASCESFCNLSFFFVFL